MLSHKRPAEERPQPTSSSIAAASASPAVAHDALPFPAKKTKTAKSKPSKELLFSHYVSLIGPKTSLRYFESLAEFAQASTSSPRLRSFCGRDQKTGVRYDGSEHKNHGWPDLLTDLSAMTNRLCRSGKYDHAIVDFYGTGDAGYAARRACDFEGEGLVSFIFFARAGFRRDMLMRYAQLADSKADIEQYEIQKKPTETDNVVSRVSLGQGDCLVTFPVTRELCHQEFPKRKRFSVACFIVTLIPS